MSKFNWSKLLNFESNEKHEVFASEANKIMCLPNEKDNTDSEKFGSTLGKLMNDFGNKQSKDHRYKTCEHLTEWNFADKEASEQLDAFCQKHNITVNQFFSFLLFMKSNFCKLVINEPFSNADNLFFEHLEISANQFIALCLAIPSKIFSLNFWENLEAPENQKAKEFVLSIINCRHQSKENIIAVKTRFIALLQGQDFTYPDLISNENPSAFFKLKVENVEVDEKHKKEWDKLQKEINLLLEKDKKEGK